MTGSLDSPSTQIHLLGHGRHLTVHVIPETRPS